MNLETLLLHGMATYARHTPLEAGRWRLLSRILPWTRRLGPGLGQVRVRTRAGFRMELDLDDWLGQHVFATGEYEPGTSAILTSVLRPGDAFVDVGAHVGYFTLLAAHCVGPEGSIDAFEPLPCNRVALRRNLALNALANVRLHDQAAADVDGPAELHAGPRGHSGISSLRPIAASSGPLSIRTARLDDLLPPGLAPRLVKIDAEGAELRVLRGMERLLDEVRPDLVVEVTDSFLREMGDDADQLRAHLLSRGYSLFAIAHDGLVPLGEGGSDRPHQFNAYATCRRAAEPSPRPREGVSDLRPA